MSNCNTYIFLDGAQNGTATLENSSIACNKVIYIYTYTPMTKQFQTKIPVQGILCICPLNDLHKNIQSENWQHPNVHH